MRRYILNVIFVMMSIIVFSSCNNSGDKKMEDNSIFEKGDQAPSQVFTGTVWVKMLHTDENKDFDTQAYNVIFEPGGRTFWHSHPGGQILFVTSGKGYYQEKDKPARPLQKGDVVAIPPHVVHWHGAGPNDEFVHLGISSQVHLGPAEWFGPVTEEQYSNLD